LLTNTGILIDPGAAFVTDPAVVMGAVCDRPPIYRRHRRLNKTIWAFFILFVFIGFRISNKEDEPGELYDHPVHQHLPVVDQFNCPVFHGIARCIFQSCSIDPRIEI
jgi:hypothetical protein